jgi:branched-chain amino acid aminotransferase
MTAPLGTAWVDGRPGPLAEARVPVSDRGFLFADSVFETVRTYQQRPFLLGDHLDRLRRSAQALMLPVPPSDAELISICEQLLAGWPREHEAALRIIVTRGDGGAGLALPEPQRPRLVVLCRPLPVLDASLYEQGVAVVLPTQARVKERSVPAHVKSGSYLANVLALLEARQEGGFEALLRATDGSLSEASTSNLFLVKDGGLVTPGVHDSILPGITRALVIALARSEGLAVREQAVDDAALLAADEVFLTSSIKEVLPVVAVGERAIGAGVPGPVTRSVMEWFRQQTCELAARHTERLCEVFPE